MCLCMCVCVCVLVFALRNPVATSCHAPVPVMDAIMRLVQSALALDTGTVTDSSGVAFNTGVDIILYAIRMASRVDNYLSFLIQHQTNTHDTINARDLTLRGVHISKETLAMMRR